MVAAEKVGALQEEGTALEWTGTAAAEATGQDLAEAARATEVEKPREVAHWGTVAAAAKAPEVSVKVVESQVAVAAAAEWEVAELGVAKLEAAKEEAAQAELPAWVKGAVRE